MLIIVAWELGPMEGIGSWEPILASCTVLHGSDIRDGWLNALPGAYRDRALIPRITISSIRLLVRRYGIALPQPHVWFLLPPYRMSQCYLDTSLVYRVQVLMAKVYC